MKTGDRVVCIKGHHDPSCVLKENAVYEILAIRKCSCGSITLDVGIFLPFHYGGSFCSKCEKTTDTDIWWLRSDRFAPIQYNSATEELANKEIVEEKLDVPVKEPQKEKA